MARSWGCIVPANNNKLDTLAKKLVSKLKLAKIAATKEKAVVEFLDHYFTMKGEDITDTVIRDNVWVFLLKHANVVGENRLEELWTERQKRASAICTIM